jgi:hypothetical protein
MLQQQDDACAAHTRSLSFALQPTHFLILLAQEKDDWIGAIGRAIVQSSSTYQHEVHSGDSDSDYDYQA